jgi:hypothetical protein
MAGWATPCCTAYRCEPPGCQDRTPSNSSGTPGDQSAPTRRLLPEACPARHPFRSTAAGSTSLPLPAVAGTPRVNAGGKSRNLRSAGWRRNQIACLANHRLTKIALAALRSRDDWSGFFAAVTRNRIRVGMTTSTNSSHGTPSFSSAGDCESSLGNRGWCEA